MFKLPLASRYLGLSSVTSDVSKPDGAFLSQFLRISHWRDANR